MKKKLFKLKRIYKHLLNKEISIDQLNKFTNLVQMEYWKHNNMFEFYFNELRSDSNHLFKSYDNEELYYFDIIDSDICDYCLCLTIQNIDNFTFKIIDISIES